MKGIDVLNRRCTQIADRVVPEYRAGRKSYSCTGGVAKRWQAAWDGACIALGYDPKDQHAVLLVVTHETRMNSRAPTFAVLLHGRPGTNSRDPRA